MEEKKKIKQKQIILMLIGVAILIVSITGITFAFFNYTKTGGANIIKTGNIEFNMTQGKTISLQNVFPITSTEALADTSNTSVCEIVITGRNTYAGGVEYLVSTVNATNTDIPVSILVTVGNNGVGTNDNLGTSDDDYFTNRNSYTTSHYKILSGDSLTGNEDILVGYIASSASMDNSINGKIMIRAYFDKDKMAITDTPEENTTWQEGRTVMTTSEWNALNYTGISFQVRVEANEGRWVKEPQGAYGNFKNIVNTPITINFANGSSPNNGEGLYILPGTENDPYPIYYYRGEIDNNNVVFGGFCWQIVRTTDTGGIKMIYNGLPDIEGSGNNITYNCGTTRNIQDTIRTTLNLSESTGYYYADDYEIVSISGNSVKYKLKSKNYPITQVAVTNATAATTISSIAINYPYTCINKTATGTCTALYKVDSYASGTDANVYSSLDRTIIETSVFNLASEGLAGIGYMYNETYMHNTESAVSNAYFGNGVSYNGNTYTLTGIYTDSQNSVKATKDANHHYTCNDASNYECLEVRFYYYDDTYITLTNGDTVEDALYKMTGNGSIETKTKNLLYVLNQTSSIAKTKLELWFKENLTNEVDLTRQNYQDYLEDTIFCNDRSFKTLTGYTSYSTYEQSGWNPNGGNLTNFLHFGATNRFQNNWYSTTNIPTIKNERDVPNNACPNETDRFSVGSLVAHLEYPVGLLTADEIVLAGATGNDTLANLSYYLFTRKDYWALSAFKIEFGAMESVVNNGGSLYNYYSDRYYGLRPVISLKLGTKFESGGDGTALNPYVVKYN